MKSLSELMLDLEQAGVQLSLRDGDISVRPVSRLTVELLETIRACKAELTQYLAEQGETVISDSEEASHADSYTPPAPEMTDQDRLAASVKAAPRLYQGGGLLVNSIEGQRFGHYMRQLVREREKREAAERGEVREGYYQRKWDIFK